jgi:hypothetical protein
MTRIRPPTSAAKFCRPVVNVLESLSLRIGYAKGMLVAVTGEDCPPAAPVLGSSGDD